MNNAGYGLWGPIEALSEEELRRQFDTNFLGQWRMVHAVAPHLRAQRWGKIINVSSLSGRVPSPMLAPYAASKHAVEALTEGLREELVAWGVSATALEPGMYASDWQTAGLDVGEEIRTGRSPYTAADPPGPRRLPPPGRHPSRLGCRRGGDRRHRPAAATAAAALAGRRGLRADAARSRSPHRRGLGAPDARCQGWGLAAGDVDDGPPGVDEPDAVVGA